MCCLRDAVRGQRRICMSRDRKRLCASAALPVLARALLLSRVRKQPCCVSLPRRTSAAGGFGLSDDTGARKQNRVLSTRSRCESLQVETRTHAPTLLCYD